MTVYAMLFEITSKDNCMSVDVSGAAARTCFESGGCNLRQFLIFLSVTGTLLRLEPTEMLGLLTDSSA